MITKQIVKTVLIGAVVTALAVTAHLMFALLGIVSPSFGTTLIVLLIFSIIGELILWCLRQLVWFNQLTSTLAEGIDILTSHD